MSNRVVNEVIGVIKRTTMVPRSVIDERPDRIKVKNGVLVFFETPEHVKEEVLKRLNDAVEKAEGEEKARKLASFYVKIELGWTPSVKRKWLPHLERVRIS